MKVFKLKSTIVLISLFMITNNLFSQEKSCGSDEYWERIQKRELSTGIKISNLRLSATNELLTIPVVVHVLYTNSTENISDAQIQSQMVALNKDYRKFNTDTNKIPSVFKNTASDCEIQFCLAQRDPWGAKTNGITRKATTISSFSNVTDNAKHVALGGVDAWDSDKYLNIWVVPQIQTGSTSVVLGYSSFPGEGKANDGVVIGHKYFGTMGTVVAANNKGRTGTHEIGHWLGLYHTFQGGCAGTTSTSCSTAGDMVCDTPPTSAATYGCPTTPKNSCTETTDQIDMTMNYMDYVDDACMYMFTAGQKDRMWFHINTYRSSIKTSNGCVPVVEINNNVALKEIKNLEYLELCSNEFTPTIELVNTGKNMVNTLEFEYGTNAQAKTYIWNGSLAVGQTTSITLGVSTLQSGDNPYFVKIKNVNGLPDLDTLYNVINKNITVMSTISLPFTDNFESNTLFNQKWTIRNPDNRITWERSSLASVSGNYALFFDNTNYPGGNWEIDDIVSPPLFIQQDANLSFKYAYKLYTELGSDFKDFSDTLRIYLDENCTGDLSMIYEGYGLDFTTGDPYFLNEQYIPTANEWRNVNIDLAAYEGKYARLVLRNISDNENSLFIDDLNLNDSPLPVGVDDLLQETIHVYPTKTKNIVNISAKEAYSVNILDATGQIITSKDVIQKDAIIDISQYSGSFFIFKITSRASSKSFKIIKE